MTDYDDGSPIPDPGATPARAAERDDPTPTMPARETLSTLARLDSSAAAGLPISNRLPKSLEKLAAEWDLRYYAAHDADVDVEQARAAVSAARARDLKATEQAILKGEEIPPPTLEDAERKLKHAEDVALVSANLATQAGTILAARAVSTWPSWRADLIADFTAADERLKAAALELQAAEWHRDAALQVVFRLDDAIGKSWLRQRNGYGPYLDPETPEEIFGKNPLSLLEKEREEMQGTDAMRQHHGSEVRRRLGKRPGSFLIDPDNLPPAPKPQGIPDDPA